LVVVTALAMGLGTWGEGAGLPAVVVGVCAVIAYLAGGFFGAKNALETLIKERKLEIDMLMVLAALGAASIGQWGEGALLLFLFSLSNVLQDYAIGRSRQAIQSLFKLYPETAQVKRNGAFVTVRFEDIVIGDELRIQPGERVAVDGVVIGGQSSVDEAAITGESMPVDKMEGASVFAGTLNKQGSLDVRATKTAQQTTLARIIQLVESAQGTKAPTERFLERFEQGYATLVILATLALIALPPLVAGVAFDANFYRAMVFMTVASPCALIISVPAAYISAIASSARMGVLLKGGAYLEHLARLNALAFDKTGTLTLGAPTVTDVLADGISQSELLAIVASVEAHSEHPLARAIVAYAQAQGAPQHEVTGFEALVGRGVSARYQGTHVQIGSIAYLQSLAPLPDALREASDAWHEGGKTSMGVLQDGVWRGAIALADPVRPTARALVAQLQAQGVRVVMLTGDNPRVAQRIAAEVGIQHFKAGLMPEEKVQAIQDLLAEYGTVGMVGDGVNDAPALATATVGIAMGGAGTDVAMETADVVLMSDKLEQVTAAMTLAKRTRRVVWQNIVFALGVMGVLVFSTFAVDLPLPLGVLGHEGSTVIVVVNSLVQLLLYPEWQRRK
jgi:Cd2+/Zn2+-exporting ATPase